MPLLKIHKDKHHVSNSNPKTAAVCYKCDEVESTSSLVKKQTRNSSTQNTPFDEPIFRFTDDKSTLEVNNEVKREVVEATDCQEFLRDEKPILLKGSQLGCSGTLLPTRKAGYSVFFNTFVFRLSFVN